MYNKEKFDKQAEREGLALQKQGFRNYTEKRSNQAKNYNKIQFDKLFRD